MVRPGLASLKSWLDSGEDSVGTERRSEGGSAQGSTCREEERGGGKDDLQIPY